MPGLFGWIELDPPLTRDDSGGSSALAEMGNRMRHNGDEVVETYVDEARGIAIARIAPRGLAAVPWPPRSLGEGANRVFLDGSLQGSAAHVEARLDELARRGNEVLASLRGFFSVARWEPSKRRLALAVDRRASRPLVLTKARGKLFFAPEVKALLVAPGFDKTLDEGALGVFLGAGHVLAGQTLFASTRRLAGGEALIVEGGKARIEVYHRASFSAEGDGTRARDLEEEMADLVRGAVERNLVDPARTVVFLSGGVDSRAIAERAAKAARSEIRTVTWASPRAARGSDLLVADRVARALGTRHEAIVRRVGAWGARLTEVTYLLDGLTDLPAYHGYEYTVMRALAASGARVVLRGDECFGWLGHVASLEEAMLSINLRCLGHLGLVERVMRPVAYARWCEGSAAALAEAARPLVDEHPDDAKDLLYFTHRLQGYLSSAAYLKHVVLDHRAPLLDEALLDLNARVPAPLRADKRLFERAVRRGDPRVWGIPLATRGNLEDWDALLAARSPVRAHVERELADAESGLWELFDPDALAALLPPFGAPRAGAARAWIGRQIKPIARAALGLAPPLRRRVSVARQRSGIRASQVVLRAMVLKAWFDLFVTGDGSRRALEARMVREIV